MKENKGEFICFAHRGASGHEPENTLLAVEKALTMGAPWIEIDVFSVDDELVVIHDERLECRTDGSGLVTERSLTYLRSLDAGRGQRIPFLREVFDLVRHRAGINVELKGPGTAIPAVRLIREYLTVRGWDRSRLILSSFRHRELEIARRLDPHIRLGVLVSGMPNLRDGTADRLRAFSVHASLSFVSGSFVRDAHRRGLRVFVYTVNTPRDLIRVRDMGVDGVFTDYPELVVTQDT